MFWTEEPKSTPSQCEEWQVLHNLCALSRTLSLGVTTRAFPVALLRGLGSRSSATGCGFCVLVSYELVHQETMLQQLAVR